MEDNNAITEQSDVLDYKAGFEQMRDAAQKLYNRVAKLENTWMLQRANFLFKVLELNYFDDSIKDKAKKELENFLFPEPEEEINQED